jgi:hypothetical protein
MCPLRQCRDGNPPRRNQGCIRPVSCPLVRRGWCLGPGRVSNDDLPPAFGAAPQPAGDRCHQGNARRSTLAELIRLPSRPKHSATEGHVTVTARPNRCHTLSQPLQCVYCRIILYGIKTRRLWQRTNSPVTRSSTWPCDRNHNTARGPGGPCSAAARSLGRRPPQLRPHRRLDQEMKTETLAARLSPGSRQRSDVL